MMRARKLMLLGMLLAGSWLPVVVTCDPGIVRVVGDFLGPVVVEEYWYDDGYVVYDDYCCGDDVDIEIEYDD